MILASATACNGGGPVGRHPVATVDGHDITFDDVQDLMRAQERFYEAERKKQVEAAAKGQADTSQVDGLLAELRGTGVGTWGTAGAASALSQLITYEAMVDELAQRGVKVTEADTKKVRDAIVEQVGGEAELKKLDEEFVDFTIKTQAASAAFQAQVAKAEKGDTSSAAERDARVRELYEQTKAETPVCVNLIAAADQAAADAALNRVEAGEDFGAVAAEVSQDPGSAAKKGFLGCATSDTVAQSFPADYSDVQAGDVFGPITTADGSVVVIQIASLTGPELDQVREQIEAQVDAAGADPQGAATAALDELLVAADVYVDSRYGTWDPKTGTVRPPTDPGMPSATFPGHAEPTTPAAPADTDGS
ncbi:MAG: PpiC-type peptidyl-prolyl cis-trans isomerase [Acidimicrobiales bacterium]|nr:PpiC-type peptidyl-prolyl cis-trans isomerase [Acidimicrobiales bacterium]